MAQENTIIATPVAEQLFAYPLHNHAGHLIAEVTGRRLLIDTGAPVVPPSRLTARLYSAKRD